MALDSIVAGAFTSPNRNAALRTPAVRTVTIPGLFRMHRGGALQDPIVAFETWGRLNRWRSNAVLIFTGISATTHAASSAADPTRGWWEDVVGPGRPIDTTRYFVICVNSLGSCHGSTGPSSVDPRSGSKYGLRFPRLSIEDIAEAGYHVVKALGIEKLQAVVGPSMGGMAALALQCAHRGIARRMLLISCAINSTPTTIALRSLQRKIVRMDPLWNSGDYVRDALPVQGMKLARMLGMISYRSPEEWQARFARKTVPRAADVVDDPTEADAYEVNAYLEDRSDRYAATFDPNSYLYLSAACDSFDLADVMQSALARNESFACEDALVIGVQTDRLFPLSQQRELAEGLKPLCSRVELAELGSIQGHDAFLADVERFGPVIGRFLGDAA